MNIELTILIGIIITYIAYIRPKYSNRIEELTGELNSYKYNYKSLSYEYNNLKEQLGHRYSLEEPLQLIKCNTYDNKGVISATGSVTLTTIILKPYDDNGIWIKNVNGTYDVYISHDKMESILKNN